MALVCGLIAGGAGAAARGGPSVCAALQEAADPALESRLGAIVDQAVSEGFAGQVALIRKGRLVFHRAAGYADLNGHVAVTESTLFHVASITKYVTAAAVLRAAELDLLDVDASIAPLVGQGALAQRSTTFADLLSHRSGLGSTYAAEGQRESASALAAITDAEHPKGKAGRFNYSNDGYDLLAILLERTSHRPYEQFVRDEVFAPACIEGAEFWGDVDLKDARRVGQPLTPIEAGLVGRNYGMLGSAGLLISATDLAAWQFRLHSGRVLDEGSIERLMAPRDKIGVGHATYGAFLVDHPRLGPVLSARGFEDWGDNAILNHYPSCESIVAVVTSRGPAENSGKPPFRSSISEAIEGELECGRTTDD
jgi:CubicO group peptidase (beta-lactamase class C family)